MKNIIVKMRNINIRCKYRPEYKGVFGYADDLSLLCLSFSGMRKMLKIWKRNANDITILFNVSKKQILYFSKCEDLGNTMKPMLCMNNCQLILYVKKYTLKHYFKFF